jgi:hypothetical protein
MSRTETLELEWSYTLSEVKKPIIPGLRRKHFPHDNIVENSINNHLKTPDEIDADFILEIYAAQSLDTANKREVLFKNRNDNTENSDTLCSGFMEENY